MKTCPQCSTGYPDSHTTCPTHGVLLNEIRDLKPGLVIHQSYRIVRKLGQGGMGAVYLAQHTLMNEPRALKFLSPELSSDQAFTARFLREVRVLRQIRNHNVVDCGDLEAAEDGSLFFSMEFVDGPNLRAFLHDPSQYQQNDCHPERSAAEPGSPATGLRRWGGESKDLLLPLGSLPVPLALSIARQIAEGLGAAHSKGMVHRDIKPENILLKRDAGAWLPKIADFGIVATKESSTAYTRTGGTLLTMAYAAPEQWRGTPAASLDGRTDLYALGGLLYEMLTGQTPFHAENYEGWSRQHQTTPPQPPSTLRPDLANWQNLDALVLRLLAKDRNDRPKDVAELAGLLDMVVYVPPRIAHPITELEIPSSVSYDIDDKTERSVPVWVWAATIAILLVVAFAVMWEFRTQASMPRQYASKERTSTEQTQPMESKQAKGEVLKPSVQQPSIAEKDKQAIALYDQKRYYEAKPLLDKACLSGSWEACMDLGDMYRDGHGVAEDDSRAITLFAKACDAGFEKSCNNLGLMYHNGKGVAKNDSRAVALYSRACDAGVAKGCTNLGYMAGYGYGMAKNESRALALNSKGCNAGDAMGCDNLGSMYANGYGVARDDYRAYGYYSKACDSGYAHGCSNLGDMYKLGYGVKQDSDMARQFLTRGCNMGDQWGCGQLKKF